MEQFHTEHVIGKMSPFKTACGEAHSLYKKRNDQSLKKASSQQIYGWCLSDQPEKLQVVSGSMGAGQNCKNLFSSLWKTIFLNNSLFPFMLFCLKSVVLPTIFVTFFTHFFLPPPFFFLLSSWPGGPKLNFWVLVCWRQKKKKCQHKLCMHDKMKKNMLLSLP